MSRQSRSRSDAARIALMILVALTFFCGTALPVNALGVTPGRSTIDFEAGLEKTSTFTITNNEHKKFNAYIYTEGTLGEYITFEEQIIEFTESDNSKKFTYNLKLPERLDPPGDHWGKIVVMELPEGWEAPEGETRIVATVAVMHQVRVKVPYPGKFLQLDLSVQEAVPGEPVNFFVKLYNLGKEDIAKAQATIEIIGPTNEVIATLETKAASIKSMAKGELFGNWKAEVNPGMYHAAVTVRYDGEVGKASKNFYVGNMLIDILGVSVKDFRLGGVAKFDILAESKWNQPINDVYAHMVINDQQDNKVADFKSASLNMESYEKAHMYAYWDTEGVQEGDYMAKLALHYGDRVTEKEISTRVGLNDIKMDIVGVSAGAVTSEEGLLEQSPLIILVVVLIAINLSWFFYFRKRRT
jgi:hypothetical protein